jgi:hypothetical protein
MRDLVLVLWLDGQQAEDEARVLAHLGEAVCVCVCFGGGVMWWVAQA